MTEIAAVWVGNHRGVGSLRSESDSVASVLSDPVWQRGAGLLETMLGVVDDRGPRVPLAQHHHARLAAAAGKLEFPVPERALFELLATLIESAGTPRVRLRLVLGVDGRVVVTAAGLAESPPESPAGSGRRAQRLLLVRARRDARDPTCAVKTTSRMFFEFVQREAEAAGADQALWCSTPAEPGGPERVAECTWSNLLSVTPDGRLRTPRTDDGAVLPGVARAVLLDVLRSEGVDVDEVDIVPGDLEKPGSALLVTNAVRGPQPAELWPGTAAPCAAEPTAAAQAMVDRVERAWHTALADPGLPRPVHAEDESMAADAQPTEPEVVDARPTRDPLARTFAIVAGLIGIPTLILGCLIRGAGGVLGPIMGPWAGIPVGHHDCTFGTVAPLFSTGLVIGFVLVLALTVVAFARWKPGAPPSVPRVLAPIVFAAWYIPWCATAVLSLINSTS